MIAAINTALSQLNKVEAGLTIAASKQDMDVYEEAGAKFNEIPSTIKVVFDTAEKSNLVKVIPNQTVLQKLWSGLSDIANKIKGFFTNLSKSDSQQYKEKFTAVRDKYEAAYTKAEAKSCVVGTNEEKGPLDKGSPKP